MQTFLDSHEYGKQHQHDAPAGRDTHIKRSNTWSRSTHVPLSLQEAERFALSEEC